MGIRRASSAINAAGFQFHHKQQIERHQSTLGPDFNSREVDRRQHVPMGLKERGPRSLMLSLRSRFDTVRFEDVFHGGIGDIIANIGQGALDAVEAPSRVFPGEPQNQVDDDLADAWSADGFSLVTVVPLLRHELLVPAEDCVGSDDGRQFQSRKK